MPEKDNRKVNSSWPKNCIWPAPIREHSGMHWDEDLIPMELDSETQDLVDIKDYFEKLRENGILNEDYSLNEDYIFSEEHDMVYKSDDEVSGDNESESTEFTTEGFVPEIGDDYWDDGFDIDLWREDLSNSLNYIKIDQMDSAAEDPAADICRIISYNFINENLLRQAFTRRSFQQEYHLSGCSEELEFLGDSVLSLYVTKELMKHFSDLSVWDTVAPFQSKYDEGEFSRLKSKFVCKEHLAKRCEELGLSQYILYSTGEVHTESSREDAIEALIGAVAMDCGWDWDVLEDVIDKLIDLQISRVDEYLKKSYYELFNAWHQKHFGCLPEYEVYRKYNDKNSKKSFYNGVIKFQVPENDQGIDTRQFFQETGETRSRTRSLLARCAYDFVVKNGLWINIKEANIVPDPDSSINQLQELFQKGYIEKAEYTFERQDDEWHCTCLVNDIQGHAGRSSKAQSKKYAAYQTVVLLLSSAGCCKKEWFDKMIRTLYSIREKGGEHFCSMGDRELTEAVRKAEESTSYENGIEELPDPEKRNQSESIIKALSKAEVRSEETSVSISPNGPIGLKYRGVIEVLHQIPAGRVITERVLLKWLGGVYSIENLQLLRSEIPRAYAREQGIPFHRFLTTKGLIEECYMEQLKKEGHEVVETKTANWRVLDYKETMVDVKMLTVPEKETAIGSAEHYMNFVSAEYKKRKKTWN